MINRIGFACLMSDSANPTWKVGRTFRSMKDFQKDYENGLKETSKKALENLDGALNIINFCYRNPIRIHRMSSNLLPFMGMYEFEDLPDFDQICSKLRNIGKKSREWDIRLTFHPDHFVKLAPINNQELLDKSINVLEDHSRLFDIMDFSPSLENPINIHIGGSYGDKFSTIQRFTHNLSLLSSNLRKRLVVENDDEEEGFTPQDLLGVGLPIIYDTLHRTCHGYNMDGSVNSYRDDIELSIYSWGDYIPVFHHASSARLNEDPSKRLTSHAKYIYEPFPHFEQFVDVEIEAKQKELAVLNFIRKF